MLWRVELPEQVFIVRILLPFREKGRGSVYNFHMNIASIRQTFDFAWITFKENFRLLSACVLTFFGSWVVLEVLVIAGQRLGFLWWFAAHLGFFVVFAGLEVGFIKTCLDLHDGKHVVYSDLFRELRLGASFLLIQLIYFVMVFTGLAFLVILGVYLGTKFTFYAYSFADGYPSLKQSFQQSGIITQDLMWFSIDILLLNIVGTSVLGIGLIVTVPLTTLMKVHVYRQLTG